MERQLQIFAREEFGEVRVIEIDGEPWFVGKDIARALGYRNTKDALRKHVDAEDQRIFQRSQNATFHIPPRGISIINESGLYSLILSCKLPSARLFKRWITSDVIPSIRRHGAYITDEVLETVEKSQELASDLFKQLQVEKSKIAVLEDLAEELVPKAIYCDRVLQSKNTIPVSLIAKEYGMTAADFNRLLHELHIQYPMAGTWLLYQPYARKGYTRTRTCHISEHAVTMHTQWTQPGRRFLYEKLKSCGIVPLTESARLHSQYKGAEYETYHDR